MKIFSFLPRIIFAASLFFGAQLSAQESYAPSDSLYSVYLNDSLTDASQKSPEGNYYDGVTISPVAGSRLTVHCSSFGQDYKDMCIIFQNGNGQSAIYFSGALSGQIDIDSSFSESTSISIYLTTKAPGEKFSYSGTILYASPSALKWHEDAAFGWKVQYVLKQSDNGFKFIKGDLVPGLFNMSQYNSTAQIKPGFSFIYDGMGSISYQCTLGRGTQEQAEDAFKKAQGALFECLGQGWTFDNGVDEKGMQHFSATMNAPTSGACIHNLSYLDKKDDSLPKYQVYLYVQENVVDGKVVSYDLVMQVVNDFWQY